MFVKSKKKLQTPVLGFLHSVLIAYNEISALSGEEDIMITNRNMMVQMLEADRPSGKPKVMPGKMFGAAVKDLIEATLCDEDSGREEPLLPVTLIEIPVKNFACIVFTEKPAVRVDFCQNNNRFKFSFADEADECENDENEFPEDEK